jgi:uncharacterized protein GlcG (DUF336 family)
MSTNFPPYGKNISIADARLVLQFAVANVERMKYSMAVAIVDTGGHLVAFEKLDNTHIASVNVAQDKARSASIFRRPTKVFQDSLKTGGELLRVLTMTGACAVDGGVPIIKNGEIVGAIGVSGGLPEQDADVANSSVQSFAATQNN